MELEECRSEESLGLQNSVSTAVCDPQQRSSEGQVKTPKNYSSPSGKRKRQPNSPPSSPNAFEGFGDSEAGKILQQFPELEEVFTIITKVGEGTFSNVYLAKMKAFPDQLCALKHIIPTSGPTRIENELKCLQYIGEGDTINPLSFQSCGPQISTELISKYIVIREDVKFLPFADGETKAATSPQVFDIEIQYASVNRGKDNVIGIETAYRRNDHIVFVLPYVDHRKFQEYFLEMSMCHIREYMKNLFIALRRVHGFDVIHRDVKPSNFLYSFNTKQYSLVDFGLAMPVPGSTNSLLVQSSEKKPTTPKNTSKNPIRRSTRLSPQVENNQESQDTVTKKQSPRIKAKSVLKPNLTHSKNVTFACHSKNFKMPQSKKQTKVQELKQTSRSRLLCPDKHSPDEICSACMSRSHQNAPRAGTPGFRSPEVLLKYPNQTTAVDIWSGGVIMLCLLSGRYPFFRAYDDMTALAQIISILGSSECVSSAGQLGKDLILNAKCSQGDLKAACQRLRKGSSRSSTVQCTTHTHISDLSNHDLIKKSRHRSPSPRNNSQCSVTTRKSHSQGISESQDNKIESQIETKDKPTTDSSSQSETPRSNTNTKLNLCNWCKEKNTVDCNSQTTEHSSVNCKHLDGTPCDSSGQRCCWSAPSSAYDLLQRCLDLNPSTRITAKEALEHPFFKE